MKYLLYTAENKNTDIFLIPALFITRMGQSHLHILITADQYAARHQNK